jgi:hypothetical protein
MALCNKIIIAMNKGKAFGTHIKSVIPNGAMEKVTSQ